MSKLAIFSILWWLTGNPITALLFFLFILYLLDRRFTRFFPSATRPLRRNRQILKLKDALKLNPHDTSNKRELARLLIEKKNYKDALPWLSEALTAIPDSAAIQAEKGLCLLKLNRRTEGEQMLLAALEVESLVLYGEPYLRLGEAFAAHDQKKALTYLEKFKDINTSSSEAWYRLGQIYRKLSRSDDARQAFEEAIEIYRILPKYKKRSERTWALHSSIRLALLPLGGSKKRDT
ncbi:Tetratricopeptide repeat-containing protein [Marininema mesophilum]|uniref:Tetratricopeptide repeat-containing protein n=1 Tax=Marininema mesophilum TaxID=1048340 RepID=A0A1H2W545_9BACL|nr:tetratricopeptide repeat protein [Marininema mesophilum]SDW75635.1 Tetratricopeptide repeat-containing protein [Marininema mesophilum]